MSPAWLFLGGGGGSEQFTVTFYRERSLLFCLADSLLRRVLAEAVAGAVGAGT